MKNFFNKLLATIEVIILSVLGIMGILIFASIFILGMIPILIFVGINEIIKFIFNKNKPRI
jgi:hypothetical protein